MGLESGTISRQTTQLFRLADYRTSPRAVYFNRGELSQLLALYSRHVIRGEWRDYAIDHRDGFALFSVFRRSQESPAFTVMKCPSSGARPTEFLLFSGRRKLKACSALADILELLRRKPSLISES